LLDSWHRGAAVPGQLPLAARGHGGGPRGRRRLSVARAARLVTDRLVLRRAAPGDLAALHAMMSDAETMAFWSTPPHPDLETTRDWLRKMIAAPPEESDDFIVELEGVAIGKLGAWRWPEIGYLIGRPHWGRGYAREALAAFIPYA